MTRYCQQNYLLSFHLTLSGFLDWTFHYTAPKFSFQSPKAELIFAIDTHLNKIRLLHILKTQLKSFSGKLNDNGRWDQSNKDREIQQTQMMLLVLSGQVHQQNDNYVWSQ